MNDTNTPIVPMTIPKYKRTTVYKLSQMFHVGVKSLQIVGRAKRTAPDLYVKLQAGTLSLAAAKREMVRREQDEVTKICEQVDREDNQSLEPMTEADKETFKVEMEKFFDPLQR
jgi:hypothetical protein